MINDAVGIGGLNEPSDVELVQRLLNGFVTRLEIPELVVDGDCGHKTKRAITAFQFDVVGFAAPDGRVEPGGQTWRRLVAAPDPPSAATPTSPTRPLATLLAPGPATALRVCDHVAAAARLDCDVPAIMAVARVEAACSAFDGLWRPTLRYERHLFHRLTQGRFDEVAPDVSCREPGAYGRGGEQYPKLARAYELDPQAALESCAWGMFQMLGLHHEAAGFASVVDYVRAMCQTEREHLDAFASFIAADRPLHEALCRHDWTTFALRYNGRRFHRNHYDRRMAEAFRRAGGA